MRKKVREDASLSFAPPDFSRKEYYSPDPAHLPAVDWRPPTISQMPSWSAAKRVSIDVECKDPDLKALGPGVRRDDCRVVGVAFAIEDGPAHYLPISHTGGDNCDWDVWGYLRQQFRDFRGTIVGNRLPYDYDWLAENNCDVLRHDCMDVQVLDVLLNEWHMRYDLDSLCARWDLPGKDETVLRETARLYRADPKRDLWRFPARFVAQYGIGDVRRPLQILRRQEAKVPEEDVQRIWDLERQVTPILVKMRRRGVRIDVCKMLQIEQRALAVETEEIAKIRHATGVTMKVGDVWKQDVVAHALEQGGYSTGAKGSVDKGVLARSGEVGEWLKRAREWNKLRTTFCKQVRQHLVDHGGGEYRVHCTFHQLRANDDEDDGGRGVRHGRFSSTDFNIQQQPVRHDEFGDLWRSIFVADYGARWCCSDWSQQEPRIAVHYAEQLGLPGAKEFADEYRKNPALDIHQKLSDLSGIERKIVKNFVNGRLYAMGDAKLCRAIGRPVVKKTITRRGEEIVIEVPGPEGQAIIDEFGKFAPWIQGLTKAAMQGAEKRLYVRTMGGRKCRFQRGPDGKIYKSHKAFNRVGQGTAADQAKATLVEADRAGIPIQAIVHDEFDFSFEDEKQVRELARLQRETMRFSVPMKVDSEVGPSWGELEKLDAA